MRLRFPSRALLLGISLALLAPLAAAEGREDESESSQPAGAPQETLLEEDFTALDLFDGIRKLRPRIRFSEDMTIQQDFGSAEVDSFETGLRTSVVVPLSRRVAIRLVGEGNVTAYDFHGNEGFLDTNRSAGDPFDELWATDFRVEGRYEMFDDWALVGGSQLSSRWESGSAYEKGLTGGGFIGVAHLFRERFSVVVGMAVGSRMGGRGVSVRPVAQLGWRITENIEIETRGLALNVSARVKPDLTLFLRGGLQSRSYRLEDRGGEVGRGTLQDRSVPIRVGAHWRIAKRWRLRAFAGAVVYQRYAVYDSNGDFFDSTRSRRPAFTGRGELEYRF